MKVLTTVESIPKIRELGSVEYPDCDYRCTFRKVEIAGERYLAVPATMLCPICVPRLIEHAVIYNTNLLWAGAVA